MTREIHESGLSGLTYSDWTGASYTSTPLGRKFDLVRPDVVKSPVNALGWRNPTPYYVVKDSWKAPHGTWRIQHKTNAGVWSTRVGALTDFYGGNVQQTASLPSAGLRSRAEVGALLKLKDQKVNLSLAFSERKRTANLAARTFTQLAMSFRLLRKGNFRGAARELGLYEPGRPRGRTVPQRWLELQYGWSPLLSDVYGSCVELDRKYFDRYIVTVEDTVTETSEELVNSPEWGLAFAPIDILVKEKKGVKVRLDYTPDAPELSRFASLGLGNPAVLAWELLPFSFVVDWALPVGDWLSSLDAAFGYTFKGGTMTQIGHKRLEYRNGVNTGYPNYNSVTAGVSGRHDSFRLSRSVYEWSPIPTLPRLKNPWSYSHAANAASLLANAFSGTRNWR